MKNKKRKHYKKYAPVCTCGYRMQKRQTLRADQKRWFCSYCGIEQH